MKKKLKLNDLKVQSFVTSSDTTKVIGGESYKTVCADTDTLQTMYSCLAYITCNVVACAVNSNYVACTKDPRYCNIAVNPIITDLLPTNPC